MVVHHVRFDGCHTFVVLCLAVFEPSGSTALDSHHRDLSFSIRGLLREEPLLRSRTASVNRSSRRLYNPRRAGNMVRTLCGPKSLASGLDISNSLSVKLITFTGKSHCICLCCLIWRFSCITERIGENWPQVPDSHRLQASGIRARVRSLSKSRHFSGMAVIHLLENTCLFKWQPKRN